MALFFCLWLEELGQLIPNIHDAFSLLSFGIFFFFVFSPAICFGCANYPSLSLREIKYHKQLQPPINNGNLCQSSTQIREDPSSQYKSQKATFLTEITIQSFCNCHQLARSRTRRGPRRRVHLLTSFSSCSRFGIIYLARILIPAIYSNKPSIPFHFAFKLDPFSLRSLNAEMLDAGGLLRDGALKIQFGILILNREYFQRVLNISSLILSQINILKRTMK